MNNELLDLVRSAGAEGVVVFGKADRRAMERLLRKGLVSMSFSNGVTRWFAVPLKQAQVEHAADEMDAALARVAGLIDLASPGLVRGQIVRAQYKALREQADALALMLEELAEE